MFDSNYDVVEGAETPFGVVEAVSSTAALIAGSWIPFYRLVKDQGPAEVLDPAMAEALAAALWLGPRQEPCLNQRLAAERNPRKRWSGS